MKKFQIELDEYEIANLRCLIETIGYPAIGQGGDSPFRYANNGDWIGQIYWKLPETEYQPNNSPEQLRESARKWLPREEKW